MQETWVRSWVGKIPWRRERLPTSPWGLKELGSTERLSPPHIFMILCEVSGDSGFIYVCVQSPDYLETWLSLKIFVFVLFQGTKVCVCIQICHFLKYVSNFFWDVSPYIKVKAILFIFFLKLLLLLKLIFMYEMGADIQFYYFQNVSTLFFYIANNFPID